MSKKNTAVLIPSAGDNPDNRAALPALGAPMVEWAHYYAKFGLLVLPMENGTDQQLENEKYASSDHVKISEWWDRHPNAGIGIVPIERKSYPDGTTEYYLSPNHVVLKGLPYGHLIKSNGVVMAPPSLSPWHHKGKPIVWDAHRIDEPFWEGLPGLYEFWDNLTDGPIQSCGKLKVMRWSEWLPIKQRHSLPCRTYA